MQENDLAHEIPATASYRIHRSRSPSRFLRQLHYPSSDVLAQTSKGSIITDRRSTTRTSWQSPSHHASEAHSHSHLLGSGSYDRSPRLSRIAFHPPEMLKRLLRRMHDIHQLQPSEPAERSACEAEFRLSSYFQHTQSSKPFFNTCMHNSSCHRCNFLRPFAKHDLASQKSEIAPFFFTSASNSTQGLRSRRATRAWPTKGNHGSSDPPNSVPALKQELRSLACVRSRIKLSRCLPF